MLDELSDLIRPDMRLNHMKNILIILGDLVDMTRRVTADSELHKRSLHMAERFLLPAAYDAHYLALADQLGAELWTLDRRLARAVGDVFPWVRVWQA